jgi:hypothetical protein
VAFPETNIELQLPYRKHLKVGDVFRLRYPGERYFLGQVSSLNAKAGGFDDCILINIFAFEHSTPMHISSLPSLELLIAPLYVNRLGFSRGYMPVIGNAPVKKTSSEYCYFDVLYKKYLDSEGNEIAGPKGVVGSWGLSNYLVMDDLISEKLGLPIKGQSYAT